MNLVPAHSNGSVVELDIPSEADIERSRAVFESYLKSEITEDVLTHLSYEFDFTSGWRKGALQAFESLPEDSQLKLIHMAHPSPEATLFVLRRLGWLNRPVIAIPLVEEIATAPVDDPVPGLWFPPSDTFVEAWVECARHMESPPLPKRAYGDSHRAWQLFGQILFWLQKSQNGAFTLAQCDPLWDALYADYPFEAADCLWRLGTSDSSTNTHRRDCFPLREFIEMFAPAMRRILSYGVSNYHQLPRQGDQEELDKRRFEFLVSTLGYVGDESTEEYLRKLTDPNVLLIAQHAIKTIQAARQQADGSQDEVV